ncbi:MAG: SCO family protein [Balneolaceae bacterium]
MNRTKKLSLTLFAFFLLPTALLAQHGHGNHTNNNALNPKEVNMEHSLFHMSANWTNHRNETLKLSDFSGNPVVIVMYYGNCVQVCPILIRDANRVFKAVDESLRKNVRVLAVTFDPQNDTIERLHAYAEEKELNIPEWHFITGNRSDIRELAMLLGVEYTKKGDGHFAHSNLVTVLDDEGKIIHRLEGLNQPVDEAAKYIETILNTNPDGRSHQNLD